MVYYKNMKKMLKSQWAAVPLFFLLAVLILYSVISQYTDVPIIEIAAGGSAADLTDFDFSTHSALISTFEAYPDKLLMPAEIDKAEPEYEFSADADYHTIRSKILVPDGSYLIYKSSPEYASRFYVNGEFAEEFGYIDPGNPAMNSYKVAYMNILALPADGVIEVVMHIAGVIRDDAAFPSFVIGAFDTVKNEPMYYVVSRLLPVILTLTFAAFHFGHFMFTPKRRENLWFALIALSTTGLLFFSAGPADVLFPDISYNVEYRIARISIILICVFYPLFIWELFGISKRLPQIFCTAGAVIIMLMLTLPVNSIARSGTAQNVFVFATMAVCTAAVIMKIRLFNTEEYISFGGQIVFMTCGILDSLGVESAFGIPLLSYVGITVFLFAQMLALYIVNNRAIENEQRLIAANAALVKLNSAKTELLGNISHEFKTPLTVISNVSELTANHTQDGYIREKMEIAISEVERMKAKAGQLLRVARLDDPDTIWEFKPVNIEELVNEVIYTYFGVLNERGNIINVNIPHSLPPVLADAAYLRGVVINLIENAMRFTHNGMIDISAVHDGDYVRISVKDTGCGMTEEESKNVFEKFYTGGKSTGTGLGLYICKKTIEAHGGEIIIQSTPGSGTAVTFTLQAQSGLCPPGS